MRTRLLPVVVGLVCALAPAACDRPDPALQPDAFLRDSLGLGDDDRVHTVRIATASSRERAEPDTLSVLPGDFVQFVTQDRRPHTVAFLVDSLADTAAAFLRRTGQEGSPPLVEAESRFLVSFQDAPEGRYPYRIEGTGEASTGAVVVARPRRGS